MKILVVEDETDIQTLVKMALEFTGKHEIQVADNGAEGLTAARAFHPDLILLDVMMPKLDGFETLRRLQADEELKRIPVIFLTAKAQQKEVGQGMELGAIGYITKPFDAMQLNGRIMELLEEKREKDAASGV